MRAIKICIISLFSFFSLDSIYLHEKNKCLVTNGTITLEGYVIYWIGLRRLLYQININSIPNNFANARYLHNPFHSGIYNVVTICLCLVLIIKPICLLMNLKHSQSLVSSCLCS